ncbi:MAG: phosphoglycolate phosphatase [Thiohalomonadaceae bacterium]
MSLRTILFDLDGTLADTAPDLAYALNQTLEYAGRAPLPFATIRPVVSHGGTALLQLGFGEALPRDEFDHLRDFFLDIYRNNLTRDTRLFPGMTELLDAIEARGLNWGVVTNKPAWLTEPLMAELGLTRRAVTIISGDTLPERKPHPAPMLRACQEAGSTAGECLYLGDAERDIAAGRNAGMHTVVALYGYIGTDDEPRDWGADGMIAAPQDLLRWLS